MKATRKFSRLGLLALVAGACLALALVAGCSGSNAGSNSSSSSSGSTGSGTAQKTDISIACLARDEQDITYLAEKLSDKYNITSSVMSDNNALNEAVNGGDVTCSLWEDAGTMQKWNEANSGKLASYGDVVFFSPIVMCGHKGYQSLDNIKDGGLVVISDNSSSRARGLQLMAKGGLITLNDAEVPTTFDIVDNPHNFQFLETSARNAWASFADADYVICAGNTILAANDPDVTCETALLVEADDIAAAKGGVVLVSTQETVDSKAQWLSDVTEVLHSKEYVEFVASTYKGAKVAKGE